MMSSIFIRGRRARLVRAIRTVSDEHAALAAIRREIEPGLESITRQDDRDRLYRSILSLIAHTEPRRLQVTRDDFMGALNTFLLVFATALPAAVPFLFVGDPWLALRLSNLLLVGLLFIVGYCWARYTDASPWLAGLGVMLLGIVLVAIAIPLGG
jgi:VIT1/CCC1 family predicted Fe2+/Mn2+ transporter